MFNDGSIQQYAANILALSMYGQVDSQGHITKMLDDIIRYSSTDESVHRSDGYMQDSRERKPRRITTKCHDFLLRWRDGSQSGIPS